MMILIDGDACNVIHLTETIAKAKSIPCHIYCDTHRILESDYSEIHIVDSGRDSADFAIVNKCNKYDIVITNDTGLAAMVLARNCYVINTRGVEYNKKNIMTYLTARYMRSHEARKTNRNQVKGVLGNNNKNHTNYSETLHRVIRRVERINFDKEVLS